MTPNLVLTLVIITIFATLLHLANRKNLRQALRNMDFWGTTTSLLCAIHCALVPIVISLGYVRTSSLMTNPLLEVIILGLTAVFVFFSIIKPYLQSGKNPISFYLALTGISLVILHYIIPIHATSVIVLGGISIAFSHVINLFYLKKAK